MFARSFSDATGAPCEVVCDAYIPRNGEEFGRAVLGDHEDCNAPVMAEDRHMTRQFHAQGAEGELL